MHETITYESDMYLTKKDVKDIQEIFKTPLIGTYNWDYSAADDRINRLYQLAKKRQWNVEIDLDWSQPWNQEDLTLEDYAYNHQMFNDYKPKYTLRFDKRSSIKIIFFIDLFLSNRGIKSYFSCRKMRCK